jgi:GxxExxY protein
MNPNEVTRTIVDAAYKIHTTLGPGLLESVYESALAWELENRGLTFTRQQPIPVTYEQIQIQTAFIADLIVDNQIIVEIKSTESIAPVHKRQLLTYLKLADKRLGLLINFNVELIKDGIFRIANNLKEEP